jgi:hypothetical protein
VRRADATTGGGERLLCNVRGRVAVASIFLAPGTRTRIQPSIATIVQRFIIIIILLPAAVDYRRVLKILAAAA